MVQTRSGIRQNKRPEYCQAFYGIIMFGHVIVLSSMLFGLNLDLLFDLDSMQGIVLLVLMGLSLIIIGFVIKGVWGAVIAFAIGILSFLYIRLRF